MRMNEYAKQVIRGEYMPHVDGIRALAVIAVVLYHFQSSLCPGGFSGVDVFFVISGYLIGGGILRDLSKGSFSFTDFYMRRIKRIMPAYFVMICVSLLVGIALYHYEPLESLGYAALRSSYYFANFFFYKYVGNYFTGNADTHPLTNLWSLSVEEQFYIIIPFLMWALWKLRTRILLPVLVILALFSFLQAELELQSPILRIHLKAFYMLLPRMWELLAGVALAGMPRFHPTTKQEKRWSGAASILGLGLVLSGYIFLQKGCHFPGVGALPAVAGCVLLLRYGAYGYVGAGLSHAMSVGIGRISYSLYLWHWPILVYARYIYGDELCAGVALSAAALSVAIAYISWRYIEMPIRRAKNIGVFKTFLGLGAACALVGGTGYIIKKTRGLAHYLHTEANRYASLEYPGRVEAMKPGHFGLHQLSHIPDEKGKMQNNTVVYIGNREKEPEFILIGDSHAEALRTGLDASCAEHGIAGLAIQAKTCPLSGIDIVNSFSNITEPFMKWLAEASCIHTVIIICRWRSRLGDTEQILYRRGESIPPDSTQNAALLEEGLRKTCERLQGMGKEVVLISPIPTLRISPGTAIRRHIMLGLSTDDIGDAVSREEFLDEEKDVFRILEALEADGLARIVMAHPALEQEGWFRGVMNNTLFYHDTNHLSAEGSRYVIRCLFHKIFPKFSPPPTQADQQSEVK